MQRISLICKKLLQQSDQSLPSACPYRPHSISQSSDIRYPYRAPQHSRCDAFTQSKEKPQVSAVINSGLVRGYFLHAGGRSLYARQYDSPAALYRKNGQVYGSLQQLPQRLHPPFLFADTGNTDVNILTAFADNVFFSTVLINPSPMYTRCEVKYSSICNSIASKEPEVPAHAGLIFPPSRVDSHLVTAKTV